MAIGTLIRGDDYVLKVAVTEDNVAAPIAGDKMFFTIKTHPTDPDNSAIYQKIEVVVDSADATAGIHRFQIPNTLAIGKLFYDVQWVRDASGFGAIKTLEIGDFTITQDVTVAVT